MEIKINDSWMLKSDERNIILLYNKLVIPKDKEKEPERKWIEVGYYSTVDQACNAILDQHTKKVSQATTLRELLDELKEIREDIRKSVSIK